MAQDYTHYFDNQDEERKREEALAALAGADASPVQPNAGNNYLATEPGNVDWSSRPFVQNLDGSVSTVRSMGVNLDGQETLIPTVDPYGRIMTDDQAIAEFARSGQHLGKYATSADSDNAGQAIHNDHADFAYNDTLRGAGMLYDKNGIPIAPKKSFDTPDGRPPGSAPLSHPDSALSALASSREPDPAAGSLRGDQAAASGGDGMDWGALGGGVGWAAVADILLNHGKGVGQIVALGAQAREKKQEAESQAARQARQDALNEEYRRAQMANMGTTAELQRGQQALNQSSQALRQREIEAAQAKFDAQQAALKGHTDAEGNALPALTADEARASDVQYHKDQLAQAAQLEREKIASGEKIATIRKGGGGAGGQTMVDPDTGEEIPILSPDQKRTLDARRNAAKTEQASIDKFNTQTKDMSDAAVSARQLETEFSKYGPKDDIPGLGVIDSRKPGFMQSPDDTRISDKVATMRSAVQHYITGAAGSGPEEGRIARLAANLPGMTESQARVAVHEIGQWAQRTLRRSATGREDLARRALDNTDPGLGDWALGQLANSPAITPEAAPVPAGDVLQTTDERRKDIVKPSDILGNFGGVRRR